jgi:all-trans-retinol 13,14-reductase
MTFDSVVVGGGVSGLTAALILSLQGRKVAVVEKAPRLAPLIRGFHRQGVYFDSAFHYAGGLAEGEILDLFFRYLGLNGRLEKYPFKTEGFDLFRDADSGWEFRFPVGVPQLQAALCEAFAGEEAGIRRYFALLGEVCRSMPYIDPETSAENWKGAAVNQEPSLAEVLDRFIADPSLKSLLSLHTLLYGVSPSEVSFAFHASVTALYYRSPYGIVGGGGSLAEAFEAALAANGIATFLGRGASSLALAASGQLHGVDLTDGERLECRECLVSTHPRQVLDMVPPAALRPAFRKRLGNLEDTVSACILYGAKSADTQALEGGNLILGNLAGLGESSKDDFSARPLFISAAASKGEEADATGWTAICPSPWEGMSR